VWSAIPDRLTVKALYGEGFRMPTVRELFSVSGSRFSNPDLGPEKIRTGEVSGTWQIPERGFVEAAAFVTRARDLIQLAPSGVKRPGRTSFLNQFQNVGEVEVLGLELKAQVQLGNRVDAFGHWAFHRPEYVEIDPGNRAHDPATASLTDTTDRVPRQSSHKGLLGASFYGWKRRLVVTPRLKVVGSRPGVITSPVQEVDGYASLDVALRVRDVLRRGLDLQLSTYNVANEDILDPGFRTAVKTSDFPAAHPQPGRHVYVKLSWDAP
jgi:outer membrane receptor protein involved in Fe transport